MEDIEDVSSTPLVESNFVHPRKMFYTQNKNKKIWDLVTLHESVVIVIFNKDSQKMIFVKQFRPAVYYSCIAEEDRENIDTKKYPGSLGVTLEFCAGIVDKRASIEQIAKEEVLEECGYDAPVESLEKIVSCRGGVGVSGERQTMFYVEVTDKMKVSSGGGLVEEGELIEVVEMSLPEVEKLMNGKEVNSVGTFLFGLLWFFRNKIDKR